MRTHIETMTYRAQEFAALAGVTVRALHYYDRLGLLTPRRTGAGHRVYSRRDLESLEQIVALKRIGVPLKDIARVRHASGPELAAVLRAKRASLEEQKRRLTRLIATVRDVEDALNTGAATNPQLLRRIAEVIDMEHNDDEWGTLVRETSRHRRSLSPEVLADLGAQGEALLAEIQPVLNDDPASPMVQQLATRWVNLIQRMNGTTVPLSTLLRVGEATHREHVTKSPGLASSPWARSMSLMARAVEVQGLT